MLDDLRYRLRAIFRRREVERELAEELRFHIEQYADVEERSGVPRDEALRRARLAFGAIEAIKEESRDRRGVAPDRSRLAGSALRRPYAGAHAGLHRRRDPLADAGHRREHGDVPGAERAPAARAAGGLAPGARRDQPARGRSRSRARQLPALAGDAVPAVRGAAAAPGGVLDGVRLGRRMVQPRPGRRGAPRAGPVGERRLFPGARARRPRWAASSRPPTIVRAAASPARSSATTSGSASWAAIATRSAAPSTCTAARSTSSAWRRRASPGCRWGTRSTSRCRSARWSRSGRTARSSRAARNGGSRRSAGSSRAGRSSAPTRTCAAIAPGVFKATLPPDYPAASVEAYLGFDAHRDAGGDRPLVSARGVRDAPAPAARR